MKKLSVRCPKCHSQKDLVSTCYVKIVVIETTLRARLDKEDQKIHLPNKIEKAYCPDSCIAAYENENGSVRFMLLPDEDNTRPQVFCATCCTLNELPGEVKDLCLTSK